MFKGIVLHWTAGNYYPCSVDLLHYHYVIDKDGKFSRGKYTPEDNLDCSDGRYAAHCKGYNTGRIGVAICCRKDLNTQPTKEQIDTMCRLAAILCKEFNISVENVQTHAEISPNRKIDINHIPCLNIKGNKTVGDYLRKEIKTYYILLDSIR